MAAKPIGLKEGDKVPSMSLKQFIKIQKEKSEKKKGNK